MIKFFLPLVVLFFDNAFATNSLDYFICENDRDALICDNSCKRAGYIFFKIKDIHASKLLITFVSTNQDRIKKVLEGCKIDDTENWYCAENFIDASKMSYEGYKIFQMIDGNYSEQFNYFDGENKQAWIKTFGCAKNKK
ncbi:MAG: hypothetical protein CBD16_03860 [Betaproteobacteria bacterium TMED156]|nr:MAG: hypothetical protein CBD16_03860 [Betaproteobacteria bacterium TMED156]